MNKKFKLHLMNIRRGRAAAAAAVVAGLLAAPLAALLTAPGDERRPGSIAMVPAPRQQPRATEVDPAQAEELARLGRASDAQLVAEVEGRRGLTSLLAMNVLWARGRQEAVQQLAARSGDPALQAKARALEAHARRAGR